MCKHLGWEETLALLFSSFRCFFVGIKCRGNGYTREIQNEIPGLRTKKGGTRGENRKNWKEEKI